MSVGILGDRDGWGFLCMGRIYIVCLCIFFFGIRLIRWLFMELLFSFLVVLGGVVFY